MRPHTSGEGGVGSSDARGQSSHEHMTPPTSHVPLFFTEQLVTQSVKPLISDVSAPTSGRYRLDG